MVETIQNLDTSIELSEPQEPLFIKACAPDIKSFESVVAPSSRIILECTCVRAVPSNPFWVDAWVFRQGFSF